MRALLALAVISAALAGCAGEDVPSDDEILQSAVESGEAADLPTWAVGQFWTYKMTAGEFEIGTSSLVVTQDAGSDYIVGSNDKQIAYFDERFDITFMGEVRKSDLAGSQNGDRVEMFDWPLVAEKEWTTTWDGATLDMYANPMGEPGQFHVMGHRQSDGNMAVEYHYNPDVAWFEYIVFYDENGTEGFRMDLTDSGDAFTGTVYDYEILDADVFEVGPAGSFQAERTWSEATELGLRWDIECNGDSQGQVLMGMGPREEGPAHVPPATPFNESPYGHTHDCAESDTSVDFELAPNAGETWAIDMAALGQNAVGSLTVEPRILTETAF